MTVIVVFFVAFLILLALSLVWANRATSPDSAALSMVLAAISAFIALVFGLVAFGLWLSSPASAQTPVAVEIRCSEIRRLATPELMEQVRREALWVARQFPGPPAPAVPLLAEGFRELLVACGVRA